MNDYTERSNPTIRGGHKQMEPQAEWGQQQERFQITQGHCVWAAGPLFGEVKESVGGGALLKEVHHLGEGFDAL